MDLEAKRKLDEQAKPIPYEELKRACRLTEELCWFLENSGNRFAVHHDNIMEHVEIMMGWQKVWVEQHEDKPEKHMYPAVIYTIEDGRTMETFKISETIKDHDDHVFVINLVEWTPQENYQELKDEVLANFSQRCKLFEEFAMLAVVRSEKWLGVTDDEYHDMTLSERYRCLEIFYPNYLKEYNFTKPYYKDNASWIVERMWNLINQHRYQ